MEGTGLVCPDEFWIQNSIQAVRNITGLNSTQQCNLAINKICSNLTRPEKQPLLRPSQTEVWGYGLLFVLLVSLSSIIGVLFLPLMKHDSYKKVLMGMVGLAVGCLCGSAIFTLIPESFGFSPDEDFEKYLYKACVIVAAIYAFFLTERLLKLSVDHRKRMKNARKSHSPTGNNNDSSLVYVQANSLDHKGENGHDHSRLSDDSHEDQTQTCGTLHLHTKIPPPEVKTHSHEHAVDSKELHDHPIKTVAWMVITGDGIHNFVDGLSMGAAFSESILSGISISIAVLCEELPHELGDLAILLNSGMSLKRALLYNFLSACTCFAGLIVGILVGENVEAAAWIFAIAGGMFLYISLVDMVPELTHAAEEASSKSIKSGLTMLLIQNIGMISGFVIMFLLARYKKDMTLKELT